MRFSHTPTAREQMMGRNLEIISERPAIRVMRITAVPNRHIRNISLGLFPMRGKNAVN
jgi:hypothetical protein